MSTESTTIRVSKKLRTELSYLKIKGGFKSHEEIIQKAVSNFRKKAGRKSKSK